MKPLFYGLGSVVLAGAALVMALLPYLAPSLLWFVLFGGVASGAMAVGWLLLSLTAGGRHRLHTGPVLMAAGMVALAWSVYRANLIGAGWALATVLVGTPLWLSHRRAGSAVSRKGPGGVRHPIGRAGGDAGHDGW